MTYFDKTDRDIVVSAVKRYKEQDTYAVNPVIDQEEWNNLLDVIDNAGELKERVPADKIVNNSFAEKAEKNIKNSTSK
jgi:NitT/TauT family transport system substrate-binding protein